MRSISLFLLLFLSSACSKWNAPKATNEVQITVENQCYCKITFYNNDTTFYCSDQWDCTETKALYLQIKPGEYRVRAENGLEIIEKHFSKNLYNSSLSIQFP